MPANRIPPYYCDECAKGEHGTREEPGARCCGPTRTQSTTIVCACCRMPVTTPGHTYLDNDGTRITIGD